MRITPAISMLWALLLAACSEQPQTPSEGAKAPSVPQEIIEKDGMVFVQGKSYLRGNDKPPGNGDHYPEEGPAHKVEVSSFWIDKHEVTNAQFKKFVDATGYVTFAERALSKDVFPNAPEGQLVPGATVFAPPPKNIDPRAENDPWDWWAYRKNACWKRPDGERSSIKNRMDHPVVCVNIDDAKAYAKWAGKRLPTEAEWELAARGGQEAKMFVWGDEVRPEGKWMANCLGRIPGPQHGSGRLLLHFTRRLLLRTDSASRHGGNVWEICSDYFHPGYYGEFSGTTPTPRVPTPDRPDELDTSAIRRLPGTRKGVNELVFLLVAKGGSFSATGITPRYRPPQGTIRNRSPRATIPVSVA